MRVGLVIYGSLDTLSGGYLYDRKLVEYLRGCGDTVEIVSMPWSHYPGHLAHHLDPAWKRRLASMNVDVLLQDELNHPSLAWLNGTLKKQARWPILAIVHHLRGSETHPPLALPLYRAVEKRYLSSVDGFIFNSQTSRQVVETVLGGQVNGIVATPGGDRFGQTLSAEQIRMRFAHPGPLRLLFVGNLIQRKGLDTLIKALARIQGVDWTLRIAGRVDVDPEYTRQVRQLAAQPGLAGRIDFLGRLDDETLADELRSAHLLAVPSQYEGFGIVYLEAMAFGLPAVASNAGAAAEIIQNRTNGLLVNPDDDAQLAECLAELLGDRQNLLAMSLAARQRFDEFPGWHESMAAIRAHLLYRAGAA